MAMDAATLREDELHSAIDLLRGMIPEDELKQLQPCGPNTVYTTLVTLWMLTLQRLGCGKSLARISHNVGGKRRPLVA